mmetsp:Transcript_60537/g.136207  ORF Transcript_60537/g.136207 Transcript_60537/m.136207 type:complete len:407 (-) Transcript_60537:16-1236(-)
MLGLLAVLHTALHGCLACTVRHPHAVGNALDGAEMQHLLERYYSGLGRAPLEEVFFATQGLTSESQATLMKECPGLLITSYLMVAEARLLIDDVESGDAMHKADALASQLSAEDFEAEQASWPIREAISSFQLAATNMEKCRSATDTTTVHVVVCHCREDLDWLANGTFDDVGRATAASLYIYEKCGQLTDVSSFMSTFAEVHVIEVHDGEIRRDECSGFLRHLIDNYDSPANFTFFFQADAGDHMEWPYLSLVNRAIARHVLQVPFIHLNYPRLVSSLSPCREEVFRLVFNRSPRAMLGSYCCAQFLVARDRVLANTRERYERMFAMLFEDSPAECHDIQGHSTHCLMYEVYWHVLFGELDELPARMDNPSLPLFLRIRDVENESYLPPGSMFLDHAIAASAADA